MELMPSSAAKPEEASAIHHLRMEWEPYKSIAEPTLCPSIGEINGLLRVDFLTDAAN